MNFFQLLKLEVNFAIDEKLLEKNYLSLQRTYHPDLFINKQTEKLKALEMTMLINKAYEVIKSPLKRAEYLLSLQGIIVNSDGNDTIKPSIELLEKVMADKEALYEIENAEQLKQFENIISSEKDKLVEELTELLAANDFTNAAQDTIKLRYLEKILADIKIKKTQ